MVIRRRRKSAFVLMLVLVCMTVVIVALLAMVQRLVIGHRLLRQRERQVQVRWLVDAGFDRAAARIREDPEYVGESWHLAAGQIDDSWGAQVEIVAQSTEDPEHRRVHVTAIYPDRESLRIREERTAYVTLTNKARSP